MRIFKNDAGYMRAEIEKGDTSQDIFDAVTTRLRDGTARASIDQSTCAYRENGAASKACAVGIFIPDNHYTLEFLEGAVEALGFYNVQHVPLGSATLLQELQILHDTGLNWEDKTFSRYGEVFLKQAAIKYGLKYTPPTTQEK